MSQKRLRRAPMLGALGILVGGIGAASSPATAAQSARHSPVAVSGVAVLESVACPTAKACVAVGADENTYGKSVVIKASTGGVKAWSGKLKDAFLNAVACPTKTTCLAVADDAVATVKVSSGASTVRSTPKRPKNGIDALMAIACPTKTSCYAVGFEGSPDAGTALLVHVSAAGAVLGLTTGTGSSFGPIVCPSSELCLMGAYGQKTASIELLSKGRPGAKHDLPAGTYIEAIGCYKATACYALVGHSATGDTNELFPVNPKTGAIGAAATFSAFSGSGLTCPTASECLVVGHTGSGSSYKPAVVVVTHGKPAHSVGYPGTNLNAIACATPKLCYAVGLGSAGAIVERV